MHARPFPPKVQAAIDYGHTLPDIQVCIEDLRGIPYCDWISVDFVLPYGRNDCIELGTTWVPCGDAWVFERAAYRTFSQQDRLHRLGSWDAVAAFLGHPTIEPKETT